VHQDSLKTARKERISAYPWSNFVMVNGAYALYPEYAFGITYARVKQYGFYVSAMMNPSLRFHADHYASANGTIHGEYPFYSGQHTSTRISATAGALVRLHIPMYLYAGIGYGYRGLFYETTDHKWVAWHTANTIYHGMHWEAGLIGNIKGFAISLGVSSITDFSDMYYEANLGLCYCF
jgi:opacity protein-like surface antigen